MRLTCPNCGAQYEVPDEVIPESGRDVQCSNCGDTWFQHHPDFAPEPDTDHPVEESWDAQAEPATPTEDDPEAPKAENADRGTAPEQEEPEPARRELDPAITDVLREEAARERAARASDGGLETQPELGLSEQEDETDKRTREAQARMARLRGEEPDSTAPGADDTADDELDPGTRRNLLPDIDEINSSLSSDNTDTAKADRADLEDPVHAKPGGFRRGFRLMILLALIGLLIYVFAPQIAQTVPALEHPLSTFVELVNSARVWLDEKLSMLMGMLDGLSSEGGTNGE